MTLNIINRQFNVRLFNRNPRCLMDCIPIDEGLPIQSFGINNQLRVIFKILLLLFNRSLRGVFVINNSDPLLGMAIYAINLTKYLKRSK